jgi:hypothetical protein
MAPLKGYVRITRTRHVQVEELNWKPGGGSEDVFVRAENETS